jgi:polar amino acid transport system substrate-binding protein
MSSFRRRDILTGAGAAATLAMTGIARANSSIVDEIKARGTLTAGTEAAFEPFEFLREGEIVGSGRDLLVGVAEHLNVKLDQLNLPFQGLLPGLMAKKFDLVATSVGINADRVKRFGFTRPVGAVNVQLVARHGEDKVRSTDDLNGKIVGTQLGSAVQPQAVNLDKELKAKGGAGFAELKLFQTYADAAVALTNKQVDAIMIPSNVTDVLSKAQPNTLQVVSVTGDTRYLCWVTRPTDLQLRDYNNDVIAEMTANGKMAAIQTRWFGRTFDLPSKGYLPPEAI